MKILNNFEEFLEFWASLNPNEPVCKAEAMQAYFSIDLGIEEELYELS